MESEKSTYLSNVQDLPQQIHSYLNDVGVVVEKYIGFHNVYSILIFGSYANNEYTKNSDCDFMIILKNEYYKSVNRKDFRLLDSIFLAMAIKNHLKFERNNIIDSILNVVEKTTGMFTSHFICSKESWESQSFSKIFRVNPLLSSILAPSRIVLNNMQQSIKILFGKQPNINKKKGISTFQLFKSFIMTECIAFGAIFCYPIWHDSIKYSLESLKWAYKNSYYFLMNDSATLYSIVTHFCNSNIKLPVIKKDHIRFIKLRDNFTKDVIFALKTPFLILKIHRIAFMYKKFY